ncbi:MAG TPA: hypothetical protein PLL20_18610 [Phycisphaerae bacterium]|nr:hypothetical protein [Phycisphaerae bacterium]HRR84659.1 hypothetical protein [Phycisphaerae bacterium]
MVHRLAAALLCAGTVCVLAAGESNIDPNHRFAWAENVGWLNWHGANSNVRVHPSFLSGFVWAENVGWINLGNGRPANGTAYANTNGEDCGVNIDALTGDLSGLGWGENIGWVNFDTWAALGTYGRQARFEYAPAGNYWAGRFRGYAWGENVGWINLDDSVAYVSVVSPDCRDPFADADGDGDVDQADFAIMQICVSGDLTPALAGCVCFDRPEWGFPLGDNDVDANDLAAFEACATGPGLVVPSGCDG